MKKETGSQLLKIALIAAAAFLVYSIVKAVAAGITGLSGIITAVQTDFGSFWSALFGSPGPTAAQTAQTQANINSVGTLLGSAPAGSVAGVPLVVNPNGDNGIDSIIGNYTDPTTLGT